jgi:hypothetical protein
LLGSASASRNLGADHLEHGAEDLFLVAFHVGRDMIEQRRADEKAFFMALQREAATIDDQFRAFVDAGLDPAFHLRLVRGGDHRAIMRVGVGRDADLQLQSPGSA